MRIRRVAAAVLLGAAMTSPVAAQVPGGAGPKNIVNVQNVSDNTLNVRGAVQLGRIPAPIVAPVNIANAFSSCVDCQTLAVALQIDLMAPDASQVTPQNAAVAVNSACTGCTTIALAYQYVLTVDDPTQVPPEVDQLMAQMRQELASMRGNPTLTLADAEARVDAVIGQFQDLAVSLNVQRDETSDVTSPGAASPAVPPPTETPAPVATATSTLTPTATLTPTPASTPTVALTV